MFGARPDIFLRMAVGILLLTCHGGGFHSENALEGDHVLRRKISAGDSQIYALHLAANQSLEVSLRQREISLSTSLLTPDGTQVFCLRIPPWGHKSFRLISTTGGIYRLVVSAPKDGSRSGDYQLELAKPRVMVPEDNKRLKAQAILSQGLQDFATVSTAAQTDAIAHFRDAVRLWQATGDRPQEAESLYWLGRALSRAAQYQSARDALEQAARIFRDETHDELAFLTTNDALNPVYGQMGVERDGLPDHLRSYTLWTTAHDRRGQGDALGKIAGCLRKRGDKQAALATFQKALKLWQAQGDKQAEADAWEDIALVYDSLGQYGRSIQDNSLSLKLRKAIGDTRGEASALYHIALNLMEVGKSADALGYLERSGALRHEMGDVSAEVDVLCLLADDQFHLGDLVGSVSTFQRSIALRDSIENDISSPKWRAGLQGRHTEESDLIVALTELHQRFPRSPYGSQAFLIADYVHSRFFANSSSISDPPSVADLQRTILDENTALLEYWIGNESSQLWVLTKESLRAFRLPGKNEIDSLTRRAYSDLTARTSRAANETITARRTRIAQADAEFERLGLCLSDILLAPAETEINRKRLLIVDHGVLQYLPFAILPDPRRQDHAPLIIDHEIVNLPSATMLARSEAVYLARPKPPRLLAVLADPVFSGKDPRMHGNGGPAEPMPEELVRATRAVGFHPGSVIPRLLFSRREERRLLRIAPSNSVLALRDFDATREAVLSGLLSDYCIWHFASHALLNDDPDLSGVVLSLVDRQGRSVDGFLRMQDLYKLRIPAELVVLSACQTGLAHDYDMGTFVGLTEGFLRAGARRVLSTTWNIDDEATGDFMAAFYDAMLGTRKLSPAAALRAAQVAVREQPRWHAPYYWGGFVLHGDWR